MCATTSFIRVKNSLGFSAIFNPKKSLICVEAINKGDTVGEADHNGSGNKARRGIAMMNPRNSRITPAIIVTIEKARRARASPEYLRQLRQTRLWDPPICTFDPPRNETKKPPMIAV